jgi:hypothetical protein
MSQALASARKRRAPASESVPPPSQAKPNAGPSAGLTLPQVISLVDKRLITLEHFMAESKSNKTVTFAQPENSIVNSTIDSNSLKSIVEEFNGRYEILAEEIMSMKNIVLNLQNYTMTVNKTLLDERVRVLSEIPENTIGQSSTSSELEPPTFTFSNPSEPTLGENNMLLMA